MDETVWDMVCKAAAEGEQEDSSAKITVWNMDDSRTFWTRTDAETVSAMAAIFSAIIDKEVSRIEIDPITQIARNVVDHYDEIGMEEFIEEFVGLIEDFIRDALPSKGHTLH